MQSKEKLFKYFFVHKTDGIWSHFGKGKLCCWNSGDGDSERKRLTTLDCEFDHYCVWDYTPN